MENKKVLWDENKPFLTANLIFNINKKRNPIPNKENDTKNAA